MRGKTIECISLIGLAVGPEKFTADASEVMEMLLKTQTGDAEMSDDDPQVGINILFNLHKVEFFALVRLDQEFNAVSLFRCLI